MIVLGIVAVGMKVKQARASSEGLTLTPTWLFVVAFFVVRIVQIVLRYRAETRNTESTIAQSLYYRTLGTERAVLLEILDSMEEQEAALRTLATPLGLNV